MMHPLQQRIAALRRKVHGLVLLHGASRLAAFSLAAIVVVCLMDYLIHFEDVGLRVICALAVLATLGWSFYRFVWRGLSARFRDLDLALRFERRFPEFHDRLASTLQFLDEREDDPSAGSAALRRAVIAQTTADLNRLDASQTLDWRPALRWLAVAGGVVLVVAVLAALSPKSAQIALARLAVPWGKTVWPQKNHLEFAERITRAASGAPLELVIIDGEGAPLPDEVRLEIFYVGESTPQVFKMRYTNRQMVYHFDSVSRPFSYRAEGGDDYSMKPIDLEVVEAPAVQSLAVKLYPPEYTGWPATDSDKHIRALKGTRVGFQGTATKKLSAATLCLESGETFAARVSRDGYGFSLPAEGPGAFAIERSGPYWFKLQDAEGFAAAGESRYDIRCVTDLAPTVAFEKPKSNSFVTADAVVPLEVLAKDDLAVRDVHLRFSRSDQSEQEDVVVELYPGPGQPRAAPPALAAGLASPQLGESLTVTHQWELAALELPPGTQLNFYATASDFQPDVGQSPARRLTIITTDELHDRIAERQTLILAELAQVLQTQRQSRSQVKGVQVQLEDVGTLSKAEIDQLQAAELTQREVNRGLGDEEGGVNAQIQQLLTDLTNNRVDSPEIFRRMEELADGIGALQRDQLPVISSALTTALKAAEAATPDGEPKPAGPEVAKPLDETGARQDQVIAVLEQMLGDLSQWDSYRRFFREVAGIRKAHEDVAAATSELGKQTLARPLRDLTPQQQADLKKLSLRQQDLGRQFESVMQQMQQMSRQLSESDPNASDVLTDALHHARSQGISGRMQQASQQVAQNQVGRAAQQQKGVGEDLREMLNILTNRREHELSRLVKKLEEAEREAQALQERQRGLQKRMADAAANPNEEERRRELERLRREQQQLQEDTERFARKLQRLQAEKASGHAASASRSMGQAGQQSQQGNAQQAAEQAEQALQDLERAGQDLAQQRREAERKLAAEQLAKIEDHLRGLKGRQEGIVRETERLDGLHQGQPDWTRAQALSLQNLAREQTAVMDETNELAKKIAAAEVFSMALRAAAREMQLAADLLGDQQTGESTQGAERNALRRFEQLLEALKPEKGENGQSGQRGQQGQQGQQGGQPGDGIPMLAQLKMLKLMQEEINSRTVELENRLGNKPELTETERREFDLVSRQQGELAELITSLSEALQQAQDDGLEGLPELDDIDLDNLGDDPETPPGGQNDLPEGLQRPDNELKPQNGAEE